jgi:hypothetical protein
MRSRGSAFLYNIGRATDMTFVHVIVVEDISSRLCRSGVIHGTLNQQSRARLWVWGYAGVYISYIVPGISKNGKWCTPAYARTRRHHEYGSIVSYYMARIIHDAD